MCGRYGFTATDEELIERFDLEARDFELRDSYNVAPTHEMPIIERHSPNSVYFRKWGLKTKFKVPKVIDGKKHFVEVDKLIINARTDKLMDSWFWKKPFLENRCIIPANYFIEWKGEKGDKQAILIKTTDQKLFGMAGLILNKKNDDGTEEQVFVDITTDPNPLMEKIHARMTSILRPEDEDDWLNPDTEPERLLKMLEPYPASRMEAYPISSLINSVKNNFDRLTEPIGPKISV